MSFVRLLSPIRPVPGGCPDASASSSPTSSPRLGPQKPRLYLHIPLYGAIIAVASPPHPDPSDHTLRAPQYDLDLKGELEIRLPEGSGRMRCKAIRVVLRTVTRMDMKGRRGVEEDVIFERKVEIIGGSSEGVWLEEGTQRFEFTLILPSTLAPQNWVTNASISHTLYAELEGLPEPSSTSSSSSFFSRAFTRSPPKSSSSSLHSRSPSPPGLGARSQDSRLSPSLLAAAGSMSFTRQEGALPKAPSYAESEAQVRRDSGTGTGKGKSVSNVSGSSEVDDILDAAWVVGTHTTKRTVMLVYNPNRNGGVNLLDERISSFTNGLGVYELRMAADEWHIGGWPLFKFAIPDPSPLVTIFAFRYILTQTVTLRSPRDDPDTTPPKVFTNHFPFVERGQRPPLDVESPGLEWPALWRGREARGMDKGGYKIEAKGQMPKDDVLRPSTLEGVVSPIHLSHALVSEVFFSIWGMTASGEPMAKPGFGGLQVMRLERPVVVPSCALIPQVLNLPSYHVVHCRQTGGASDPCKLCESWPHEILCLKCPSTSIPHLRHDLDPLLTGSKSGTCPLCAGKSFLPDGAPTWTSCACGLAIDKTEERMKAFVEEEMGDQRGRRERDLRSKDEWAGGRSM